MVKVLALSTEPPNVSSREKGVRRIVTSAWISLASQKLKESGKTKKEVGEAAGTSGPYLSMLLKGKYDTSCYFDAICEELGIDMSGAEALEPSLRALGAAASDLDPDHLAEVIDFVNFVKSRRDKK